MKNKPIFKVFLLGVISLALGLVSFFIFDFKSIKAPYRMMGSMGHRNVVRSERDLDRGRGLIYGDLDLDNIDKLDIDLTNADVNISYGEKASYRIEANSDIDLEKLISLNYEKRKVKIKENLRLNNNNLNLTVDIVLGYDDLLKLDLDLVNGSLKSQVDLGDLDIDLVNGDIFLKGDKAPDLEIDLINGNVVIDYESYDASFYIEGTNVNLDYFTEEYNLGSGEAVGLREFIDLKGNSSKKIEIELVNGSINIK